MTEPAEPLVSLVMPIYNAGRCLDEALASATGQTLTDLEILCVDDGSTDGSSAVLSAWVRRDPRVHVWTTANHGEGHARNVALAQARGRYLLFLDADDTLDPGAARELVAVAEASGADIVVYGGDGPPPDSWAYPVLHPRAAVRTDARAALFDEPGSYPLINKLVRRDLLERHRLRFDQTLALGVDTAFWFAAFPRAARVAYHPACLYHYRYHRDEAAVSTYARDTAARVEAHLGLVESVCATWRREGWLAEPDPAVLAWAVDLIASDAAQLPRERCRAVAQRFVEVSARSGLVGAIDALDAPTRRDLRSLVLARGVVTKTVNRVRRTGVGGTLRAVRAHLRRRRAGA